MLLKKHTTPSRLLRAATVLTTSLTIIGFSATCAHADRRKPAPIVYSGQANTSVPAVRPRANTVPQHSVRTVTAPDANQTGRRVEFRYPDQPDLFYGEGGARRATSAPPISFSSSQASISETAAKQYALAEPSPTATPVASRDPAISAGGFDARAAAAAAAKRRQQTAPRQLVSAAGPANFEPAPPPRADEAAPAARFQPVAAGTIYDETGRASVFDGSLNGQPTANGETLDTNAMVAAHPSLPLPSLVQVINVSNGKEIVVRVNDRGPFGNDGLIEVSNRAADLLGFAQTGAANVRVRYLGPAPAVTTSAPGHVQPKPTVTETPLFGAPRSHAAADAPQPRLPVADPAFAGQYVVQLASFSDISNARRMHDELSGRMGVSITSARVRGTDYFRVVTRPVADRESAERLRDQLARQGIARGLVTKAP